MLSPGTPGVGIMTYSRCRGERARASAAELADGGVGASRVAGGWPCRTAASWASSTWRRSRSPAASTIATTRTGSGTERGTGRREREGTGDGAGWLDSGVRMVPIRYRVAVVVVVVVGAAFMPPAGIPCRSRAGIMPPAGIPRRDRRHACRPPFGMSFLRLAGGVGWPRLLAENNMSPRRLPTLRYIGSRLKIYLT